MAMLPVIGIAASIALGVKWLEGDGSTFIGIMGLALFTVSASALVFH